MCRAFAAALVGVAILAPAAYAAEHKVLALPLVNGALHDPGQTVRVKQGDEVELRWSSDRPLALHLHGYDIESRVAPGKPAVMSFKATIPGRFPVEVHGQHGAAHRAVMYLEVYP
ncbi:MAG TPA: hypothetical protein VFE23_07325 [Usitatibacter sp.]|jgi:FtsP/CotA-like multicopper oxidase with cupredoxin domain|nr:hypothetical protein [Usitatibacter sp.]